MNEKKYEKNEEVLKRRKFKMWGNFEKEIISKDDKNDKNLKKTKKRRKNSQKMEQFYEKNIFKTQKFNRKQVIRITHI